MSSLYPFLDIIDTMLMNVLRKTMNTNQINCSVLSCCIVPYSASRYVKLTVFTAVLNLRSRFGPPRMLSGARNFCKMYAESLQKISEAPETVSGRPNPKDG